MLIELLEQTAGNGDVDDPIPALLEVNDSHGNRVDLLIGLRGMDPELMNCTQQVRHAETILEIVGREDFIRPPGTSPRGQLPPASGFTVPTLWPITSSIWESGTRTASHRSSRVKLDEPRIVFLELHLQPSLCVGG
jgi:hypothetical protein